MPIVEPEILIDGTHDVETTARIQERVLTTVSAARPGEQSSYFSLRWGYVHESPQPLEQVDIRHVFGH